MTIRTKTKNAVRNAVSVTYHVLLDHQSVEKR